MNNRFKFRVWSEEYKIYVKDNHYPIGGDYSLSMTPNGYVEVIGMGDYNDDGAFSWGTINTLEDSAGDCIVEQCTGIKDKDDTLIYENDYVKYKGNIYKVFWNKTKISLKNILNNDVIDIEEFDYMEIVGNEHENGNIEKI